MRHQDDPVSGRRLYDVVERCEHLYVRVDEERYRCASVEQVQQQERLQRGRQLLAGVHHGHTAELRRRQHVLQITRANDRERFALPIEAALVVDHERDQPTAVLMTRERRGEHARVRDETRGDDRAERPGGSHRLFLVH